MRKFNHLQLAQIEIAYSHKAGTQLKMESGPDVVGAVNKPVHAGNGDAEQQEDDDDDLDIDDI